MVMWESDQPVVLRDGRADHKGKGLTVVCSLQRKLVPDRVGLEQYEPTSLGGPATFHNRNRGSEYH